MSLTTYKSKRNFKESPEPTGGKSGDEKLRFVIQKHAASHLHYDFRLEMEGVLKSWAVPKGPSTDPKIKRLAMMVEDHPFDYRNFEGIIPSGYGAGTVIIWDEGYYEPADNSAKDKKVNNKTLLAQLRQGKIKVILKGKKIKGEYALVKAHGRGENGWLLFKVQDKYADNTDITLKDKSVISRKTLEQVTKTSQNIYGQKTKTPMKTKATTKKVPVKETASKSPGKVSPQKNKSILPPGLPEKKFTGSLKPMLATLVDKPFEDSDWLYEVKWDGYRAMAFINKGKVEVKSRNDKSFNEKFYPVTSALKAWNTDAILDGEVVVVNEQGISDFGALQNWRSEADGVLFFYVFDILWLQGKDLAQLPLTERRTILEGLDFGEGIIKLSETFDESGKDFFETAKKMGLEGIIAKKKDSQYHTGARSKEWLKIKANKRQEMVIGGYTKNDGTSKLFSALLAGVYENKKLIYTGKIGTGFNTEDQKEMIKLFKPLETAKPPFESAPDVNKPSRFRHNPPNASATWLKPRLVCEVSFTEMTTDGIMRHPSFQGMRIDKKTTDVKREVATDTKKIVEHKVTGSAKKIIRHAGIKERKTLLNPSEETQVKKINGHDLKFTNLGKIYWPEEKISKRDMLNYYYQVAPFILPYLKNRPQSMNRHPDGIKGKSFYFKDVTGKAPDWVETYIYHSDADNRDRNYLVAKDEASLLYMASLGCIEMNPWNSQIEKEDYPDWCIIDLDPAKNTFEQVIEAARVTHDILETLGVPSYPKTSGSTGIHIYIPLGAKYTYEQSKEFARVIARLVHEQIPAFTSIERIVKNRKGKMYIDFLQNRPQATVSAPYSLRPKPGATVSMPLEWDEVKPGLKMIDFNINNAVERIRSLGDIFKPVLGQGINMDKVIAKFDK